MPLDVIYSPRLDQFGAIYAFLPNAIKRSRALELCILTSRGEPNTILRFSIRESYPTSLGRKAKVELLTAADAFQDTESHRHTAAAAPFPVNLIELGNENKPG